MLHRFSLGPPPVLSRTLAQAPSFPADCNLLFTWQCPHPGHRHLRCFRKMPVSAACPALLICLDVFDQFLVECLHVSGLGVLLRVLQ